MKLEEIKEQINNADSMDLEEIMDYIKTLLDARDLDQ